MLRRLLSLCVLISACSTPRFAPLVSTDVPGGDDAGGLPYDDPDGGDLTDDAAPVREAAGPQEPDSRTDDALDEGDDDDAAPAADADDPLADQAPDGACAMPLAASSLRIDELMIEAVAGTGDYGEWVEVANAVDCAVNLRGLHGECPRGAKVATFDVAADLWVPAGGRFVIADSTDPAVNHYLPGVVIAWLGQPGDVLRNKGTTLTLSVEGSVIDTLTYPAVPLTVGASLAFPESCDAGLRADFSKWRDSTASWFPGFLGTPNAPNGDVSCD